MDCCCSDINIFHHDRNISLVFYQSLAHSKVNYIAFRILNWRVSYNKFMRVMRVDTMSVEMAMPMVMVMSPGTVGVQDSSHNDVEHQPDTRSDHHDFPVYLDRINHSIDSFPNEP